MVRKILKNPYRYWLDWKFSAKMISTLLNVTLWSIVALAIVNYLTNVSQTTKQVGMQLVTLGDQALIRAGDQVEEAVKLLETLAKTPSIVAAVEQANVDRADWSVENISQQDKAWTEADPSIEATVKEIAGNEISSYLIDFRSTNPENVEIFVTDELGLNIAMTNKTSDFLQADEAWWISTFANGHGFNYLGSVEYDESSDVYAMKIGVPVIDPDTHEAIGVLRGTLDISLLMNALGNVRVGRTGNIVLIDSKGVVLYSRLPAQIMKPAPDVLLTRFKSGQSGWEKSTDLDGNPSIVAYNFMSGHLGQSLGWGLLVTQPKAEANQGVSRSLLISFLASGLVAIFGIIVSTIVMSHSIASPLTMLTKMAQELSLGNLLHDDQIDLKLEALQLRNDEIGAISRAFNRLTNYFEGAAASCTAIANNDLSITITPNSEKDEMGVAFTKMLHGLRDAIGQVAENAESVSGAAAQLAMASEETGKATNQIALTIQHVAFGATQQGAEASKTSSSVNQMDQAIKAVAQGAQDQFQAVQKAGTMAAQISAALQQVTANAQSGARGVSEASDAATNGAKTIEATIAGLQTIKTKVGLSAQKVKEMGQRSEQIDSIVETINEIASQTNLLALNAAIEAARVEAKGEKTVETILQQHMLGAVGLLAELLATGFEIDSKKLENLARLARVEDLFISDGDGVIIASSNPGSLGFRFSEDPRQQSSVFRSLLNRSDGIVIEPIKAREQDGKSVIFVGISRRDRPGILQAGMSAEVVSNFVGYSRGFGVVAVEIRKLAEHARTSTKEITRLIRNIQKTVAEAVTVMEEGVCDVDNRLAQATQASNSLVTILKSIETVHQQVREIATAVQHMDSSSRELVHAMEAASTVVEANTAATKEMATHSSEMARAMENIASVSEENSAAAEEVSASTEEVLAQVDQVSSSAASLMKMARNLQGVVARFKLNLQSANEPDLNTLLQPPNVEDCDVPIRMKV